MNCPGCSNDVHPVKELNQNGTFTTKCPRIGCGSPIDARLMVPDEYQAGECGESTPIARQVPSYDMPIAASAPVATRMIAMTSPVIPTDAGGDLIAQAKARLAAIDLQIADMERMQREAKKLRAMIAAAEAAEDDGLN